jgi:hypothetical protein
VRLLWLRRVALALGTALQRRTARILWQQCSALAPMTRALATALQRQAVQPLWLLCAALTLVTALQRRAVKLLWW